MWTKYSTCIPLPALLRVCLLPWQLTDFFKWSENFQKSNSISLQCAVWSQLVLFSSPAYQSNWFKSSSRNQTLFIMLSFINCSAVASLPHYIWNFINLMIMILYIFLSKDNNINQYWTRWIWLIQIFQVEGNEVCKEFLMMFHFICHFDTVALVWWYLQKSQRTLLVLN